MTCVVLSIGTELTRGELVNSNAAWLGAELTALGFEVSEHAVVDDDVGRIVETLLRLASRARVVVTTGGLGPTTDDLTTAAVARALGVNVSRDEASLDQIRRRIERAGRTLTPTNAKQADFPEGADILPNPVGTAPGFGVRLGECVAYFMPGVPTEMKRMFEDQVAKRIRALAPNNLYQSRLRTFGLPESIVGEKLGGVELAYPGTTIGYRAHFPEIEVKVLARAASHAAAHELCDRATIEVRARLGAHVYGEADDTFAGVVGRALRSRGWTLAIAESCTGGLVGHMLTREPGASEFLLLDAVTYANSAKSRILGVDEEVIRWHGAVSPEVACAMAQGARRVSGADLALSLTGVAGPSGGSDDKPVGTVHIALARPDGTMEHQHRVFTGDRARIQILASYAGLQLVRDLCASRAVGDAPGGSGPGERRVTRGDGWGRGWPGPRGGLTRSGRSLRARSRCDEHPARRAHRRPAAHGEWGAERCVDAAGQGASHAEVHGCAAPRRRGAPRQGARVARRLEEGPPSRHLPPAGLPLGGASPGRRRRARRPARRAREARREDRKTDRRSWRCSPRSAPSGRTSRSRGSSARTTPGDG